MTPKQNIKFELVNMGAWFSANLDVNTYILTEIKTGAVSGVLKIDKYNYHRALQILIDYIEGKYGKIVSAVYNNDNAFLITCFLRNNLKDRIEISDTPACLRLNAIKEKDILDFTKENINGSTLGN